MSTLLREKVFEDKGAAPSPSPTAPPAPLVTDESPVVQKEIMSMTEALLTYPEVDDSCIMLWERERKMLTALKNMAKKHLGITLKVS